MTSHKRHSCVLAGLGVALSHHSAHRQNASAPCVLEFHAVADAVAAGGPAGVDQPRCGAMLLHLLC